MGDALFASLLAFRLITAPAPAPLFATLATVYAFPAEHQTVKPPPWVPHKLQTSKHTRRQQRQLIDPKLLGAFAGALGGMYVGGAIGSAIEGQGDYDSPGLKGFLIGAPIGGVIGAVIGWKLVR